MQLPSFTCPLTPYVPQIVAHGCFATVWQGKYHGAVVAVKVIPAGLKHMFATEKEVYELPLMKHPGIIHFLGTLMTLGTGLVVLQFAEYVSCKNESHFLRDQMFSAGNRVRVLQSCKNSYSDVREFSACLSFTVIWIT